MENGVEALKIATAVLIFVMAITITISVFTTAVQALNRIFAMHNEDEFLIVEPNDAGTRTVGIETVVPSLYRALKENCRIIFYDKDGIPYTLYEKTKGGTTEGINYIDLSKEANIDIDKLLYGIESTDTDEKKYGIIYKEKNSDEILYKKIKDITFIENIGRHYVEDETDEENAGASETADVNKM